MTCFAAYKICYRFVELLASRFHSGDLSDLEFQMALQPDGLSGDPAAAVEWRRICSTFPK